MKLPNVPQYLIDKAVKEFDELLEKAHIRYPYKGYGDDSYDIPGLRSIVDRFSSFVRDTRQIDRREKSLLLSYYFIC
jgi:hypothetical protein